MTFIDDVFGTSGLLAQKFERYTPRAGQLKMVNFVHEAIAASEPGVAEAATGCHALGQGILMFDGSVKRVEDIVVGERLMGPDSRPRNVQRLARGKAAMIDVVPVKGEPWRVNDGHILTLALSGDDDSLTAKKYKGKKRPIVDATIGEYRAWGKTDRHLYKLMRTGVTFPARDAPILDPYFVGLLLGDGTLSVDAGVKINKSDPEIRSDCERVARDHGLTMKLSDDGEPRLSGDRSGFMPNQPESGRRRAADREHHRNPILDKMRALKIAPIASENRFVPDAYKLGSRRVRLEVLAGLIDTDGTPAGDDSKCYDFLSKSEQLANDVAFIARSLGLAAYVKERTCTGFGVTGIYNRVCVSGDTNLIPCRIMRKKVGPREQIKNVLKTGFKLVDTNTIEPYYGFSLDGDGRYLLDDFTITHNTGKSFAYLVPTLYHITHEAERNALVARRTEPKLDAPVYRGGRGEDMPRVLVVTANLALQDQLARKDLPFLQKLLPWKFQFQLAKGRNNWACIDRMENTEILSLGSREDEDEWLRILDWAKKTKTGDFSELPFDVRPSLKRRVSVSAEECHGSHCSYYGECWSMRARELAGQAEVVVTNYHMFLAHLAASQDGAGTSILPRYDILILDECHELESIARSFLGFRISANQIKEALKLLPSRHPLKKKVEQEVDLFFTALAEYRRGPNYKARLKEPAIFAHDPLKQALLTLGKALQDQANGIGPDDPQEKLPRDKDLPKDSADDREKNELRKAAARAKKQAEQIEQAALLLEPERTVYHIEDNKAGMAGQRIWLCGEPIEPAPLLRAMIFSAPEPKDGEPKRKLPIAIATSATLSTEAEGDEKSIGYQASRMGAHDARRIVVSTPFDLAKRVLTVYPSNVPDPKATDYAERLAPLLVQCVEAANGRTLGLFTSNRALDVAAGALRKAFGDRFLIMKQGEAPRTLLVDRFKKDVHSVLLGTKSFWAGVDVPGEALTQVLIDKIPFDPPDDPVLDALSAKSEKVFLERSVPRAAIELRQAFGRLVRSESDYGVVVLFDRRLFSTGWGKLLVRALPATTVSANIADIAPFLAKWRKAA